MYKAALVAIRFNIWYFYREESKDLYAQVMSMLLKLFMLSLFFIPSFSPADQNLRKEPVRIFKGNSHYSSDILFSVSKGKIYKGRSPYSSDVVCTVDGDKIRKGNSPYSSDILFTIKGDNIYKGRSSYSSDIVANFRGDKLHRGTSPYSSDILVNIGDDGKIYSGRSRYSSDVIASCMGGISREELVAVLYCLGIF